MIDGKTQVDEFLERIKLTKHRDKFSKDGVLHVNGITDFKRFLQEPNILEEAGMTVFEVNRFKRLCEVAIEEQLNHETALLMQQNSAAVQQECVSVQDSDTVENLKCNTFHNQQKSDIKSSGQVMVISKIQTVSIRFKFLDRQRICNNIIYPIEVLTTIKYYEFVHRIYQALSIEKGKNKNNFTSVELYSETGYPLAPTPNIYIQPLSNWGLRDNELIYAYPKKLFNKYYFENDIDCEEFVISIRLANTKITKDCKFKKESVSILNLKIQLSQEIHIIANCIIIYYFYDECERIAPDHFQITKNSIETRNLSFAISDTYNSHERLNIIYTSCYPSNINPYFHKFNAYLFFLVREYGENRDRDRLLRRLGLLRKISCSPPLVYSLYLLFTQSPTSLPHRIAINEGIITTISLFSTSSDRPTISKFPQLWMHIEEHALTPDLQSTEIYETTFISKRTRENPRDDDTRRLLQAFPPKQDTIVTWRNVSSTHDAFSYTPPTRLEDFTEGVKLRFPLQHPVQLYKSFVEESRAFFNIVQNFKIKSDYSNVSHPPALVCSITNQLFDNPVMTPEGNTYERHAILQHIENTHTDPISNSPLRSADLIPNLAMEVMVKNYKSRMT